MCEVRAKNHHTVREFCNIQTVSITRYCALLKGIVRLYVVLQKNVPQHFMAQTVCMQLKRTTVRICINYVGFNSISNQSKQKKGKLEGKKREKNEQHKLKDTKIE